MVRARPSSTRLLARGALPALVAVQVTSCSLLVSSEDDLTGGAALLDGGDGIDAGELDATGPSGDEAGALDASPDAEVEAEAGPTVVRSWDFSLGCGAWEPVGGTKASEETSAPRSPPGACRLCPGTSQEAQMLLYLPSGFVTDGVKPATLTAYARSGLADGGAVPFRVSIYSPPSSNEKAFGSAGPGYSVASAVGVLVPDTALYITGGTTAQGCIVVDDVTLSQ